MTEAEMLSRTKKFALRAMKLCAALRRDDVSRTIGRQLTRSATSVGANYRAACRSRSSAEFLSKLGIVEEEADESAYWVELLVEGSLMRPRLVSPLRDEALELTAIMVASRCSAQRRLGSQDRKSRIENPK